jgi:predicted Kef-type K+ transport protein
VSSINLSPIDIASYVSAGALATTKLISVCKPVWNRLPKWLAVALPVLVLVLPQIAQFFAGATTSKELFAAFITSLALLMPGLAEAPPHRDPNPTLASSTSPENASG